MRIGPQFAGLEVVSPRQTTAIEVKLLFVHVICGSRALLLDKNKREECHEN